MMNKIISVLKAPSPATKSSLIDNRRALTQITSSVSLRTQIKMKHVRLRALPLTWIQWKTKASTRRSKLETLVPTFTSAAKSCNTALSKYTSRPNSPALIKTSTMPQPISSSTTQSWLGLETTGRAHLKVRYSKSSQDQPLKVSTLSTTCKMRTECSITSNRCNLTATRSGLQVGP